MKVKFLRSTNQATDSIQGIEVDLSIEMNASFTFNPIKKETITDEDGYVVQDGEYYDFDLRRGYYRTSYINNISYVEISRDCYEISINTFNNVYVFQHGELSNEKPLTKEEIKAVQMAMFF